MVSIIISEDLLVRTYTTDDAEALFAAVNNSRKHLHPWLEWVDKTTKQEHSLEYIQGALHQLKMQQGLALGVFCNGRLAGGIGMHDWEQELKRAQIGYWLTAEYEGKGIMNKCLTKFVDHLFEKIGLNKIEVRFVPDNIRSAKVAERLGCKIEGIVRQCVMRNGVPDDLVIAGLLKSEWAGREAR